MKKEMGIFALGAIVAILVIGATNRAAVFDGTVETTSGGYMFPDGSVQTTGIVVAAASQTYEWIGNTAHVATDIGVFGMTRACQATFGAGSRMCTSREIIKTANLPETSNLNFYRGWVQPEIVAITSTDFVVDFSGQQGKYLDCLGWDTSQQTTDTFGLSVAHNISTPEGWLQKVPCSEVIGVACCAAASS